MKKAIAGITLVAAAAVIGAVAVALHATSGSAAPATGLPSTPGAPANIVLNIGVGVGSCAPETFNYILVRAHVTDAQGAPVADGTKVRFFVPSIGAPNPVDALTSGGDAYTAITAMSRVEQLMPIYATAGDVEVAKGYICDNSSNPTAPPPGTPYPSATTAPPPPFATATPTPQGPPSPPFATATATITPMP